MFKKRLSKNQYRSLILARGRQYWVYAYLFAKQNRANIEEDETRELPGIGCTVCPEDRERLGQGSATQRTGGDMP